MVDREPEKIQARAAEMDAGIAEKKGRMSAAEKNRINTKARKVLDKGKKKKN